jgi:four helix bundle protein
MSFPADLQNRLYQLALGVGRFCRTLPNTAAAAELSGQLRRSSFSASANYRASRRARSRKEWLAKLGTVVEELDETDHWMAAIRDSGIKEPPQNLITECHELRAILAKSCATARRTERRRKKPER